MSDKTIGDYTAANSIDASNDYYLLEQGGVYKKINRNVGLGLSSAPLGTTDIQSPTNKTFDNTNTITIKTGNFTLQSSSDVTKQAIFSAASITAGQTRTFTFPDASGTLATIAGTQTLTNKTLTSPTITGGSIDNTTITVDSISGHTSSTIVTVANLQISNGVLNSNNSVVTANITDGAVTPAKLVSGTGSGWTWQSWTPTWTNLTVGNATVTAQYIQTGKTVLFNARIILGNTSSVGSAPEISLPVAASSFYSTVQANPIGRIVFNDSASNFYFGALVLNASTTSAAIRAENVAGTYNTLASVTATAPFTFGTGDAIQIMGFYQAG